MMIANRGGMFHPVPPARVRALMSQIDGLFATCTTAKERDDVERAIAAAMGDEAERRLVEAWGLRYSSAAPCVHVLTKGRCGVATCCGRMPMMDHGRIFNSPAGKVAIAHEYGMHMDHAAELVGVCRENGLEFVLDAYSPYFFGRTIRVMVYRPDFWKRMSDWICNSQPAKE